MLMQICTRLGETVISLNAADRETPPDPAGLFSEGGEVIKLHIEGSLTIPITGIKRV